MQRENTFDSAGLSKCILFSLMLLSAEISCLADETGDWQKYHATVIVLVIFVRLRKCPGNGLMMESLVLLMFKWCYTCFKYIWFLE